MRDKKESKALLEVRKWKKAIAREASRLHGQARLDYYNRVVKTEKDKKAA